MFCSNTALALASLGCFLFLVVLPEGPQAAKFAAEAIANGSSNGSLQVPVRYTGSPADAAAWQMVQQNRDYRQMYTYTAQPPFNALPRGWPTSIVTDWGKPCTENDQCSSGVCATSCSAQDRGPSDSTSCMCPCNGDDPESDWKGMRTRKCCCGCASTTRMNRGRAYVDKCEGNQAVEGLLQIENGTKDAVLFQKEKSKQSKKKVSSKSAADTRTKTALGLNSSAITIAFTRPNPGAIGTYGAICSQTSQCKSGICGTGCDCDSDATGIKVCSCNVPCNAPFNCCGGCFIDNNQVEVDCPAGVTMDQHQASQPAVSQPEEYSEHGF